VSNLRISKNVETNGFTDRVQVELSADTSELPSEFDLVLVNPPFHEKEGLLVELFKNTKSIMTKDGEIFIVVEDTYKEKFKTVLQRTFGISSKVVQHGNYTVLSARK